MMESSFLKIALEVLNTEKVYIGMEWRTDLKRVSLPA